MKSLWWVVGFLVCLILVQAKSKSFLLETFRLYFGLGLLLDNLYLVTSGWILDVLSDISLLTSGGGLTV